VVLVGEPFVGVAEHGAGLPPGAGAVDDLELVFELGDSGVGEGSVDGVVGPGDDVEPVHADRCVGDVGLGGGDVGGGGVHGDRFQLAASVRAEQLVEHGQGVGGAAVADPHHLAGVVVDDHVRYLWPRR